MLRILAVEIACNQLYAVYFVVGQDRGAGSRSAGLGPVLEPVLEPVLDCVCFTYCGVSTGEIYARFIFSTVQMITLAVLDIAEW